MRAKRGILVRRLRAAIVGTCCHRPLFAGKRFGA